MKLHLSTTTIPPQQPFEDYLAMSSTTVLDVQSDVQDAVGNLLPFGEFFVTVGTILICYGVLQWALNKKHDPERKGGKRNFFIGLLFTLIGANEGAFISLINYVLNQ